MSFEVNRDVSAEVTKRHDTLRYVCFFLYNPMTISTLSEVALG